MVQAEELVLEDLRPPGAIQVLHQLGVLLAGMAERHRIMGVEYQVMEELHQDMMEVERRHGIQVLRLQHEHLDGVLVDKLLLGILDRKPLQ